MISDSRDIETANGLFRGGDYEAAIGAYAYIAGSESPSLLPHLAFNLFLAQRYLRDSRPQPTGRVLIYVSATTGQDERNRLEMLKSVYGDGRTPPIVLTAEDLLVAKSDSACLPDSRIDALATSAMVRAAFGYLANRPVDRVVLVGPSPEALAFGAVARLIWRAQICPDLAMVPATLGPAGRQVLKAWREAGTVTLASPSLRATCPAGIVLVSPDSEVPSDPAGPLGSYPLGPLEGSSLAQVFETAGGWEAMCPRVVRKPASSETSIATAAPNTSSANARTTIVYSVLVGDYEALKEPENPDPRARYILFTDNAELKSRNWEIVTLDTLGLSPRRASRLPKLLPHRYLPEHDISVYIDASITLTEPDIISLTQQALQGVDLAAYPHFERNCTYAEIDACLKIGKVDAESARAFKGRLKAEGFPEDFGLMENAFLVRRNTESMRTLGELWNREYVEGAERDQFYLMYLLWMLGASWKLIANAAHFRESPHLRFTTHNNVLPLPSPANIQPKPRVNWVIGGASSKGWAYENNALRLIEHMPGFDHVINDEDYSDCAIYFDVLIHERLKAPSKHSILRLGGPNPVRRKFGNDPEDVAAGLSQFDAIVPLNRELEALASLSSASVHLAPNGLDFSVYRPPETPRSGNQDTFVVGFAGNCKNDMERAFKGLDILEKAAAKAGVTLKVLQKGKNQIPHDRMVPDFYHKIDCLAHPVGPGKEGCSNVIMEALACGVSVLTTRHCGYHADTLVHGLSVMFCERDVGDIKRKLVDLRDNPRLRQRLSIAGVRYAREHHDIRQIAQRFQYAITQTITSVTEQAPVRPRLRIALITKTFWPKFAGMEMMVHNLASELHRMGNSIVLFARTYDHEYTEIDHDYTLVRYKPVYATLREEFARLHAEQPFDVVYVQGAHANATMARQLKEEFGVPFVLRTHGEDIQIDPSIDYGVRLDPKVDAEVRSNLKAADVNISISRHVQKTALELAPGADNRMIPNGVNAKQFARPRNTRLHEHFNLPPETRILLMVGRNVRKKTFHLGVEALALLRKKTKNVVLVHIGKDGDGKNLRETAERLGVSDAFLEFGEVNYNEIPDYYAAADIFFFPSKMETFGNVTIEAMAAGLPCVEFDYGANRDKIRHGETGYIVPHGDVQAMAEAAYDLISNPEKLERFSMSSREFVKENFSWPAVARRYHQAFTDSTLVSNRYRKKLRIAFVADKMVRIKGGGGERSLTNLVNAMARRGHEVFLVIKEKDVSRSEKPFYPLHPDVRMCNILGWSDGASPPRGNRPDLLRETLRNLAPDVVVGFFLPEFGYIARGVDGLDVPLVLSHRNDPKEKLTNLTSRYPKRLPDTEFANQRAQTITVQLEDYISLLPEIAQGKARTVPNSVIPVPENKLSKPDKEAKRKVILNVARLVEVKNQAMMIRAFSRIAERCQDWDIHIYGDGPLQDELKELITRLSLGRRVKLMGTTQDIMPVFRKAKLYAFPSLYEGFSRALSEAMSHRLPSVVIDECICSRSFIGESGGGIVTPNDEEAFAEALERLIRDPDLRREMGEKAKTYMEQFMPEKVDDLWEEVLYDAAARYSNGLISNEVYNPGQRISVSEKRARDPRGSRSNELYTP